MFESDSELRAKHRELQELQENRTLKLHDAIHQLEAKLTESNHKMIILKEDYAYNLELLEAKDHEIQRLDDEIKQHGSEKDRMEQQVRSLCMKIETLEASEAERESKRTSDKVQNKKLILELREEIENMRWQTIDELACKKRELDMLREENHELLHLREASLESQRRDLTRSFETLISQREAAYTEKERLTAKRIEGLGDLFEQIKTENVRLKSELLEEKRRRDSFEAEALTRTEACRQIQWILDDERLQRQQEEDELRRRQQAASSEVTQLQAQAIELKTEFSTALNKIRADVERDKQYITILEERCNEQRAVLTSKISGLEDAVAAGIKREVQLSGEVSALQLGAVATREVLALREEELSRAAVRATGLEADVEALDRELTSLRAAHSQEIQLVSVLEQAWREQELNLRSQISSQESALSVLTEARAALVGKVAELQAREEGVRVTASELTRDLREKLAALEEERDMALAQCKEEAHEREGMRLRMKAISRDSEVAHSDIGTFGGMHSGRLELASPAFSEDFGPVSLPASPMFASARSTKASKQPLPELEVYDQSPDHLRAGEDEAPLRAENDALKSIVRQMRLDMELLQCQAGGREAMVSRREDSEAAVRVTALERRLQLTTNEVSRLRLERTRLMDIGNQLRAALHKKVEEMEFKAREEHLLPPKGPDASLFGGEDDTISPELDASIKEAAGQEQVASTQPLLFGMPALNSERTTLSQVQALERIKRKDKRLGLLSNQKGSRKVINYAKVSASAEQAQATGHNKNIE